MKTYLHNKIEKDRLGSLPRISPHKDVLKEVEEKNILHDSNSEICGETKEIELSS